MSEINYLGKNDGTINSITGKDINTKNFFQVNYLTAGKKNRPQQKIKDLRAVVLHWIGPYPKQLPVNTRSWWESESTYGSAHYIIGHDGNILATLPEDEIGYHIGSTQADPISKKVYTNRARELFGRYKDAGQDYDICTKAMNNYFSIGIEMCPISEDGTFSPETIEASKQLCTDILIRNAALIRESYKKSHNKDLLGAVQILTTHWEVVGWKNCPKIWCDYPAQFVQFKKDINKRLPLYLRCDESLIKQEYPC